jgi:hypothetical protein
MSIMNLNKDPDSWRKVSPEAVAAGSEAQVVNVLRMAIQDLLKLADAYVGATSEDRERAYIDAMQRDSKLD